jgi:predicted TIM-barrel fold metal-dependent hydrolase
VKRAALVVDTDAHYAEPLEELAEYMRDPWRSVFLSYGAAAFVPGALGDRYLGGRIRRSDVGYIRGEFKSMSPEAIPQIQATLGVAASVVVSNTVLRLTDSSERDMTVAIFDAYIRYMLDHVVDPERGIYTMPMIPWQDPDAGARIIEEFGEHPAVVGACFCTSGMRPPLGDKRYDPIYRAAQEAGLPIVFHGTPGQPFIGGSPHADVQRLIEGHFLGFTVNNIIQLCSVLLQGIPERFPGLSFLFQESGIFWVPMMMFRLDEYFLKRRSEAPLLTRLPSEYIRERFFFGTQPLEAPKDQRHLRAVVDMIGVERLVYASDYPHFDYDDPVAIRKLNCLDDQEKHAILAGNAIDLFKLNEGATPRWLDTPSENARTSKTAVES